MIPLKTENCHFIKLADIESYINGNLPFDDYRIVDEETYEYGRQYVFSSISGEFSREREHIKQGIEDGEYFDIRWMLNYFVNKGILPIGTYILDTN